MESGMATSARTGRVEWQRENGSGGWRSFSNSHCRQLAIAQEKAVQLQAMGKVDTSMAMHTLIVRKKEYVAKWDTCAVAAAAAAGEFARLVSFDPVVSVVTNQHASLGSGIMKARSAAAPTAPPARRSVEKKGPTDKRNRRIDHGKLYAGGVAAWRARNPITKAREPVAAAPVLVRSRPLFEHEAARGEWESISALPGGGIAIHESADKIVSGRGDTLILRHHSFSSAPAVTSDDELYQAVAHLPRRAAEGGMATLFCYGMTGAGKTYSMAAVHRRIPADLFAHLGGGVVREVRFSAYELVGKRCFELLPASAAATVGDDAGEMSTPKREVFLRDGADGVTQVRGVAEHIAREPRELEALLEAAVLRRETSSTGENATSSRSHAVYAITLPIASSDIDSGGGRLTLIDLAGSEGNQETRFHSAKHIAEAKEINNSLAVLRACLRARGNASAHAPFRESALTRALKSALTDSRAVTVLLACVSPACTHLEHSLRTLRTAMYLSGTLRGSGEGVGGDKVVGGAKRGENAAPVEEEELRAPTVSRGGPKKWDHAALCSWVAEQSFAAQVVPPAGMTGKAIMKLNKIRLKSMMCGSDAAVGAMLFAALRVASKDASALEREQRKRMQDQRIRGGGGGDGAMSSSSGGGGGDGGNAMGFAKQSVANPVVAAGRR